MPSDIRSTAGETFQFEIGPVERDDPPREIASSSNATFTMVDNHEYVTGDIVRIEEHLGNPLNGEWEITVTGVKTFTLDGAPVTNRAGGGTGYVTRQTPIDLTLANTELEFSAKEALEAVSSFVNKGNTAPLSGIQTNLPASPRKNMATVTIPPGDTDDLLASVDLYFDVWLQEPDGRRTRLDHGIWKIGATITV